MFCKLFVALDGTASSARAMEASIALAKQLGAAITGFVVEPEAHVPVVGTTLPAYEVATERLIERTDAHARTLLTAFELKAETVGKVFTGLHARTDGVECAIIEQAEESGGVMIVMLSHGRGKFGEFLFGTHTKNVLSSCKLPLLVLH